MSTNTRDEEASVHVELEANSPAHDDNHAQIPSDEAEIAAMKARVAEMEEEAAKLREMTERAESEAAGTSGADQTMTDDDKEAVDGRSVYVGNVSRFCWVCFCESSWIDGRRGFWSECGSCGRDHLLATKTHRTHTSLTLPTQSLTMLDFLL